MKKYNLMCQEISSCNDIGLCWTALSLANSIAYLDKELVTYRSCSKGSISQKRGKKFANIFLVSEFVKKVLKN